ALGLECRSDDQEVIELIQKLNDEATALTVTAERTFLHKMEGGCQVPIAGYATMQEDGQVSLTALVGSPDGKTILKDTVVGQDPVKVGEEVSERLLEKGAKEILDKVKRELDA
ncbi:hydroxymethylbilane synthase, partial [Flavobacterium sp. IR1]